VRSSIFPSWGPVFYGARKQRTFRCSPYARIGNRLFYLNKNVEKQALIHAIQYLRGRIEEEKTAGNVALLSALSEKLERSV